MPMDSSLSGSTPTNNGLVTIMSKEELIRQKLEEERSRLTREMGIETQSREHFKRPVENPFTKSQREQEDDVRDQGDPSNPDEAAGPRGRRVVSGLGAIVFGGDLCLDARHLFCPAFESRERGGARWQEAAQVRPEDRRGAIYKMLRP